MVYEPPNGIIDIEADAKLAALPPGKFYEIDVEGVGTIRARYPLPNAVPALAGSANSKISDRARLDHLALFIQNHTPPEDFEELLVRMTLDPDVPEDAMMRVARAIATAGTGRPS